MIKLKKDNRPFPHRPLVLTNLTEIQILSTIWKRRADSKMTIEGFKSPSKHVKSIWNIFGGRPAKNAPKVFYRGLRTIGE
jgi:hypothetical protein